MEPLIPDTTTEARMSGLERFLERYVGPRLPEFGESEQEIRSIEMPSPLQRFFRFAGRWRWADQHPDLPYVNRFCAQDSLCAIRPNKWAATLRIMDNKLVFVWENQGVWVAATERSGADPPVWLSEDWDREKVRTWRELDGPLSHFLVSFVLQELMFGSELLAVAPAALEKFQQTGLPIVPVWMNGEYAWDIDRPSYYLIGERFLLRRALGEADGDDWYGSKDAAGKSVLESVGLPTRIE
jgi:hypothetical protein